MNGEGGEEALEEEEELADTTVGKGREGDEQRQRWRS